MSAGTGKELVARIERWAGGHSPFRGQNAPRALIRAYGAPRSLSKRDRARWPPGADHLRRLPGFHHPQQLAGRIPVADGHLLVDGQGDDLAESALRGLGDEVPEVEDARAGVGLVDAFAGGHLAERGRGLQRLPEEDDVVAVAGCLAAEVRRRLLDDGAELGTTAQHHAGRVPEGR